METGGVVARSVTAWNAPRQLCVSYIRVAGMRVCCRLIRYQGSEAHDNCAGKSKQDFGAPLGRVKAAQKSKSVGVLDSVSSQTSGLQLTWLPSDAGTKQQTGTGTPPQHPQQRSYAWLTCCFWFSLLVHKSEMAPP